MDLSTVGADRNNVNIIGLKSIHKDDEGNEVSTTDYVGFENTVLDINHYLLVVGKETNLAELVRISSRSS